MPPCLTTLSSPLSGSLSTTPYRPPLLMSHTLFTRQVYPLYVDESKKSQVFQHALREARGCKIPSRIKDGGRNPLGQLKGVKTRTPSTRSGEGEGDQMTHSDPPTSSTQGGLSVPLEAYRFCLDESKKFVSIPALPQRSSGVQHPLKRLQGSGTPQTKRARPRLTPSDSSKGSKPTPHRRVKCTPSDPPPPPGRSICTTGSVSFLSRKGREYSSKLPR